MSVAGHRPEVEFQGVRSRCAHSTHTVPLLAWIHSPLWRDVQEQGRQTDPPTARPNPRTEVADPLLVLALFSSCSYPLKIPNSKYQPCVPQNLEVTCVCGDMQEGIVPDFHCRACSYRFYCSSRSAGVVVRWNCRGPL